MSPPEAALSRNLELLSWTDQGGRSDAAQVMVQDGHAFVGHVASAGFSVIDVSDPRRPSPVAYVPAFGNTLNMHLQAHEDRLFVVDQARRGPATGERGKDYAAGMRIYDVSRPHDPRQIGRLTIDGYGIHRIWYVGGDLAYVSAHLEGYTGHILLIVDVSDPGAPHELGRWWLPGMWSAGGEDAWWAEGERVALHHAIVADGIAYGSWRDGGLTLIDVSDPRRPSLLAHVNWHPPFGGRTHTALPLTAVPNARDYVIVADETVPDNADHAQYVWVVDVREPKNPVPVATFPTPAEREYRSEPGNFGPHNLHENRPNAFQSSDVIFATYQNAGVRVVDISDAHSPVLVGYFVPERGGSAAELHSADVFVDAEGIVYVTDFSAGLHILEYKGF